MARAKRGGTSVLSRQKPKKARNRVAAVLRRRRVALVGAALVLALSVATYVLMRRPTDSDKAQDKAWRVTLKTEGDSPLSDKAAETVLQVVRKNLGTGSQAELRRAAKVAQQTDSYQTVHVLRMGRNEVVVHVKPREPLLCVEADKIRYIAVDGAIYGTLDSPDDCPGPILKGLFGEARIKFSMRDDLTVALDDEEQEVVREALDLVHLTAAQNIKLSGLEHRKYRGFFITLKGRELEVAVGRAPFAGKLTKLDGILARLEEKGEQALRIELDYQGKAFIKLKKM